MGSDKSKKKRNSRSRSGRHQNGGSGSKRERKDKDKDKDKDKEDRVSKRSGSKSRREESRSRRKKKSTSRHRSVSAPKKQRQAEGSRKRSTSGSKKRRQKEASRKRSGSRSKRQKQKDSSRKRSSSGRRQRDKEREKERDKERASPRKRSQSRDKQKEKKGRSRSRSRKRSESVPRSISTASSSRKAAPRKPRRGFDERNPLPEEVALAALVPQQPPVPTMPVMTMPKEPNLEVEAFLALNPVEPHAANQLRALPVHMQSAVLGRGSLMSARDRTAVLTSRIRDVLSGNAAGLGTRYPVMTGAPAPAPPNPGTSHPGIENMITRYALDARCAQVLRLLPPDKQDRAVELPVHEARNPSAFVMAQIHTIFGWRSGLAGAPGLPGGAMPPSAPPMAAPTL